MKGEEECSATRSDEDPAATWKLTAPELDDGGLAAAADTEIQDTEYSGHKSQRRWAMPCELTLPSFLCFLTPDGCE